MLEQLKEEITRVKAMAEKAQGAMSQALLNHRLMQAQAALVSGSENAMRVSYNELRILKG